VDCEPLVAWVPDQAPDAVQEVAFAEDQVIVDALPLVIELGFAPSVTVGADALTDTVADCAALPPAPVHVNVYVALALSAPVDCEPLTALVPDQAPDAVQEVAFAEDQVSVALAPLAMALGPTLKLTVGVGAFTETVADCAALPPSPLQVNP